MRRRSKPAGGGIATVFASLLCMVGFAAATTYEPGPAGDSEFSMSVAPKLRLERNAIWARLTCPSSEVSPPCRGKIVVRDPPLGLHGPHTLQLRPLHAHFMIWSGKTKTVAIREPHPRGRQLPKQGGTWKVALIIDAEDAAGNKWDFQKRPVPLVHP